MKIFVTGASGWIGSAIVKDLLAAGHEVVGLARSDESTKAVSEAGAEVLRGDLNDLESLKQGVSQADGVIHTAFGHDFNNFAKENQVEKAVIEAMGEALAGTNKPIVVAGGILGTPKTNGFITEADTDPNSPRLSEITAIALADKGINASVVRLSPSVHDKGDRGFVPFIIAQARKNGVSAYVGDGKNHWPAVHRLDAAHLFRLAVEKGAKGARYNAVTDQAIEIREIAELIGKELNLPVKSISGDEVAKHFEWMSMFIAFDAPATSYKTQEELDWRPTHISLLEDMSENYF